MIAEQEMMRSRYAGSMSIDLIRRHAGGGLRRIAESADITIVDGLGAHLIDAQGRMYLDLVTGYGVAALGHRHPRWVTAVTEQAQGISTSPFHNPQLATYLSQLSGIVPEGLTHTALFSGGAEAVEVAVRLAQLATGRSGILSFGSAFHGKTAGARFAGGAHEIERSRVGLEWFRCAEFPACTSHQAHNYAMCDESATLLWDDIVRREDLADIGVVIVEPVLGTAGNIPPRRRFLSELRAFCDSRGWLLIFDESLTGFGRTGYGFASQLFDVVPDILVMGKAMGAGFPLSGVAASRELWAAGLLDRASATSTSYGGNPLACAAGIAVLDVLMEPSFLEHTRRTARVLSEGLVKLATESPYVRWPRGVGLMLGFDLVDPDSGDLADGALCTRIFEGCREGGLLIAADVPRVRLNPPLTLTEQEAQQALAVLGEVLI
jgi:4-aminobutyrate aminotransferase-like enzyme